MRKYPAATLVHKSHNSLILWGFYFLQNFDISFKINVLREIMHQRLRPLSYAADSGSGVAVRLGSW